MVNVVVLNHVNVILICFKFLYIEVIYMFRISEEWDPKLARLESIILKPDFFDESIKLSLELHSLVHQKEMSLGKGSTFADEVFNEVSDVCFRNVPYDTGRTFAYNIWHITRIEDICANILIENDKQVINTNDWVNKLQCTITDTGNALTAEEIADFSQKIDREKLFEYRIAVGEKTRNILKSLKPTDMKVKINKLSLQRIVDEDAVSQKKEASWLIDFWGRKNIAGLIQTPITGHQVGHLNECLEIKKKSKA